MAVTALAWRDRGNCSGTDGDAFFPEKGQSSATAKRVCNRCPVRVKCLQWAIDNDEEHGIWGGLNPGERAAFKQNRSVAA